jgi:predicted small lipoprotein YifL
MILIVNSMFISPRFTAISIALALMSQLAACGQTGPLYLPPKPAPVTVPAAASTSPPPAATPTGVSVPSSN